MIFERYFQIPGLCPLPGKCQNLMGSYICSCPPGYEIDNSKKRCIGKLPTKRFFHATKLPTCIQNNHHSSLSDVDECVETKNICENGKCINTEGGVICECPEGFRLSEKVNSMTCIDVREEQCYDRYRRGQCFSPRAGGMTKKHCCCTMGKAWGGNCEQCPREHSGEDHFFNL